MKTFPKPLSIQEERESLKRYKEGDLEAREVLINRNIRLVAHVIKKYQQTGYDMDDLLSVGTIGLIKAVNTFNVEKGSRLATYAAKCVENPILSRMIHLDSGTLRIWENDEKVLFKNPGRNISRTSSRYKKSR